MERVREKMVRLYSKKIDQLDRSTSKIGSLAKQKMDYLIKQSPSFSLKICHATLVFLCLCHVKQKRTKKAKRDGKEKGDGLQQKKVMGVTFLIG